MLKVLLSVGTLRANMVASVVSMCFLLTGVEFIVPAARTVATLSPYQFGHVGCYGAHSTPEPVVNI